MGVAVMFKMSKEREQRALRAAFIVVMVVPVLIELVYALAVVLWRVVWVKKEYNDNGIH